MIDPTQSPAEDALVVYTIAEAAAIFRVSRQVLRKWVSVGYVEAIRLPSGHLRIRKTEVTRVLSVSRTR